MIKINKELLDHIERQYPGIGDTILHYENATLPVCSRCGSTDTAEVGAGLIGRTINLAAATTKFKLIPNSPSPATYFCNECDEFFN